MKKASYIAKVFLKLSQPEVGDTITNLKLQKLLYYAQGFYLAIHGKPLFEEQVLAWEHGPVVREVYNIYREFGADTLPIPDEALTLTQKEVSLIKGVWQVYGQFSAWKLREMTHSEAPWKDTPKDKPISHTKLISYFKHLVVNG